MDTKAAGNRRGRKRAIAELDASLADEVEKQNKLIESLTAARKHDNENQAAIMELLTKSMDYMKKQDCKNEEQRQQENIRADAIVNILLKLDKKLE